MTSAQRQAIVAALGTIEGVKAYPAEPDQKHPGAAWPVLRELNPGGTLCRGGYLRGYDVFAVLPNGYGPQSADAAEGLIEDLVAALETVGEWTPPAETVQIAFDNQTTHPGIRVRVAPEV